VVLVRTEAGRVIKKQTVNASASTTSQAFRSVFQNPSAKGRPSVSSSFTSPFPEPTVQPPRPRVHRGVTVSEVDDETERESRLASNAVVQRPRPVQPVSATSRRDRTVNDEIIPFQPFDLPPSGYLSADEDRSHQVALAYTRGVPERDFTTSTMSFVRLTSLNGITSIIVCSRKHASNLNEYLHSKENDYRILESMRVFKGNPKPPIFFDEALLAFVRVWNENIMEFNASFDRAYPPADCCFCFSSSSQQRIKRNRETIKQMRAAFLIFSTAGHYVYSVVRKEVSYNVGQTGVVTIR